MSKNPSKAELTEDQRQIQDLAAGLSDKIKEKEGEKGPDGKEVDYRKVEYVGVVYRNGDTLRVTDLYTTNDTSQAPLERAIHAAGGADNVVAVVHNHPEAHVRKVARDEGTSESDNRKANMLPSEGDWNGAAQKFKDRRDVTYFLLGPDDKLRRYEYEDRVKWNHEREGDPMDWARGRYDPELGPVVTGPSRSQSGEKGPSVGDASLRSQQLYEQAMQRLSPPMHAIPDEDRQRMGAYAAYLASGKGMTEITSVAMNYATAHHQAGEFLCVAGKSGSPDPYLNGAAAPADRALKGSAGEWLTMADQAHEARLTPSTMQQAQVQGQSQDQGAPTLKRF